MSKTTDFTNLPPKQITLADTTAVLCPHCEGDQFMETVMLRKVSRILTGDASDSYQHVEVLNCVKCGKMLLETLHPQIQALLLKEIKDAEDGIEKSAIDNGSTTTTPIITSI